MTKLKLGPLTDDKPVKLTVELPAAIYRDLTAYADLIGKMHNQPSPDPAKLIVPMIQRFIATDRAFAKARRTEQKVQVRALSTPSVMPPKQHDQS